MGLFARIGKAVSGFFTRETVKPTTRQGVGGTIAIGGFLQNHERAPELNSPAVRYRSFNEMVLNNTTVGASVWLFLRTVIQPEWESTPAEDSDSEKEAQRIADLWDDVINDMRIPFYRVVRNAALFKLMGFSVQERIAKKRDDGVIGFDSIERRPQWTIEQWDIDEDDGMVVGFGQRDPMFGTMHYIPRSKCIYIVDDSITDSPDGIGMLRLAFEGNRQLKRFEQLEGWMFEMDARGMPIGTVPIGELDQLVADGIISSAQRDARIKPVKDIVKNHVKNPGLGLVIDSAVYRDNGPTQSPSAKNKYGLELLRGDAGDAGAMDMAIKRKEAEIARVMNTEHLLLGADGKGSLALSKEKLDAFVDSIRSVLKEIAQCFDDDLIDDWMEMNGFDDQYKPKFQPNRLQLRSLTEFVDNIVKMSNAGAYTPPDDPVWAQARSMMDAAPPEEMPPMVTGELFRVPKDPLAPQGLLAADPNAQPGTSVDLTQLAGGTEPVQPTAAQVGAAPQPKQPAPTPAPAPSKAPAKPAPKKPPPK